MSTSTQVRGQPLVALLAILAGWAGGRLATWEPPALIQEAMASEQTGSSPWLLERPGFVFDAAVGPQSLPGVTGAGTGYRFSHIHSSEPNVVGAMPGYRSPSAWPALAETLFRENSADRAWNTSARVLIPSPALTGELFPVEPARRDAEFSGLPPLSSLFALAAQPSPPTTAGSGADVAHAGSNGPKRWSADSWMLMRRGGGALASGALPATYGASQAGAVLRYGLAPRSGFRPAIYLRTTSTLGQLPETSAALGVSARPLPNLPVVAALEARLTDQAGIRRFQPALMAVSEIAPFALPLEMRGEAYAQAGYVAGKFATPFADGQFRLDRSLYRIGAIDARLGGGAWGGVQKGAGRFDVGPSAAVSLPLARKIYGRAALDWRFRVIGNASPQSGPAVTLSAGF